MKLYKSWLLPATCTIILVVATYATTTQAAKQTQAEVNFQQVAVSPSRSLKYGDKTTKKLPNEEVLLPTTSPASVKNKSNSNKLLLADKQQVARHRLHTRTEHVEEASNLANVPMPGRYDNVSEQLHVPNATTIAVKNNELYNKPIAPTAGQQRTTISNRSRSANQQQQQQLLRSQYASSNNVQRKPTTTSHPKASTINNNQHPLSSHNSLGRSHHPTSSSNSTIVRHSHSDQRHKNSNVIRNTQPLSASSNAFAATSDLQSKTESSSNKQTGKLSANQSVSSNTTNGSIRSIVRKFTSNASTITIMSSTSTSTTTTTTTTTSRPPFQLPYNFNIFTPEFWQFLNPTSNLIPRLQATTTRKPPKKYKPPTQLSTKEEKLSLVKPKQTILSRTTTKPTEFDANYRNKNNNTSKKDDGPYRIALPTLSLLSSKRETHDEVEKGKRNVEKNSNLRERFECPRESEVRFQLFPKICKIDEDCKVWNREEICCDIFGAKSCVSGIPKPLEETSHAPILGVIPRKCPNRPLAELWWEVKECEVDFDCWPRVCCPDGRRRYCRTSQPELNTAPVPVQRSFNYLSEYLECTAPPPPIFDLHPKTCTSTFDCFPNVCCQEAGLRHCRPPKKSVLTMLANIFNVDFVKRLTQNIVIK